VAAVPFAEGVAQFAEGVAQFAAALAGRGPA
jgi:hypothetical protein